MEPVGNPADRRGRIIFLNGTSSSGKSSVADALLWVLDEPWFHLSVDAINAMRSKNRSLELDEAEHDVVVDHVLSEQWRLLDCLRLLAGYEVTFVAVRCSPQELASRERARGDREAGHAAAQLAEVHAHGIYDLECDTTATTPMDCALAITEYVAGPQRPAAFDRLRSLLLDDQRPAAEPAAGNI
jgi:chloramphenicol 3-O phosphotransferase